MRCALTVGGSHAVLLSTRNFGSSGSVRSPFHDVMCVIPS